MIRQVQDDYKRVETHRLRKITTEIREFLGTSWDSNLIILNLNVRSLQALAENGTTDTLLCGADLLVFSETWMEGSSMPISLRGYVSSGASKIVRRALKRRCDSQTGAVIASCTDSEHRIRVPEWNPERQRRRVRDPGRGIHP